MTDDVEVFFDTQVTAGSIDELITESTELVAKVAAAAIVLWFSISELASELAKYRAYRRAQHG